MLKINLKSVSCSELLAYVSNPEAKQVEGGVKNNIISTSMLNIISKHSDIL